jgi:hypothetical protein
LSKITRKKGGQVVNSRKGKGLRMHQTWECTRNNSTPATWSVDVRRSRRGLRVPSKCSWILSLLSSRKWSSFVKTPQMYVRSYAKKWQHKSSSSTLCEETKLLFLDLFQQNRAFLVNVQEHISSSASKEKMEETSARLQVCLHLCYY